MTKVDILVDCNYVDFLEEQFSLGKITSEQFAARLVEARTSVNEMQKYPNRLPVKRKVDPSSIEITS